MLASLFASGISDFATAFNWQTLPLVSCLPVIAETARGLSPSGGPAWSRAQGTPLARLRSIGPEPIQR